MKWLQWITIAFFFATMYVVITGIIERYITAYETITGTNYPLKVHNAADDLAQAASQLNQ